jgi:hypothetical protein
MRYTYRNIRPRLKKGVMNKTEQAYASRLLLMRNAGEIIRFEFEKIKFKLADNTFYEPDFYVVFPDHIEIHEVKGHWEDDARVKIKVAAEMFPEFKWVGITRKSKTWLFEEF